MALDVSNYKKVLAYIVLLFWLNYYCYEPVSRQKLTSCRRNLQTIGSFSIQHSETKIPAINISKKHIKALIELLLNRKTCDLLCKGIRLENSKVKYVSQK